MSFSLNGFSVYAISNICLVQNVCSCHGRESVVDEEKPGRRVVSTTDATIAAVDSKSLMQSDRRVMG